VLALLREAAKRIIMSGTPVANKPEDLWAQLFFLDDGERLGPTFEAFKVRYGPTGAGYRSIDDLRAHLSSISIRREKQATISLPPKMVSRVGVKLGGRQLRMYEELRVVLALWVRTLSGDEVLAQAENILSRMVRLAQIASNPGLLDASYDEVPAKFDALDKLIPSYKSESAEKAIIWTSFVDNIPALVSRYRALKPVTLYGEMDNENRDRAVTAFRQDRETRLLIANPAAAREGLTLTEARTAIYLDRTFNLVDFLQSQDRIHRISQTGACEIVLLIAENTIDEFVDYCLAQKHRLARYTQADTDQITQEDLGLEKPDALRALLTPAVCN
jgi:SNF2 family DNA or RNA helicase